MKTLSLLGSTGSIGVQTLEVLRGLPEQVDYFDEGAWYAMVDFVTVYGKEDVQIIFKNGMEVPTKIE